MYHNPGWGQDQPSSLTMVRTADKKPEYLWARDGTFWRPLVERKTGQIVSLPESNVASGKVAKGFGLWLCHKCIRMSQGYKWPLPPFSQNAKQWWQEHFGAHKLVLSPDRLCGCKCEPCEYLDIFRTRTLRTREIGAHLCDAQNLTKRIQRGQRPHISPLPGSRLHRSLVLLRLMSSFRAIHRQYTMDLHRSNGVETPPQFSFKRIFMRTLRIISIYLGLAALEKKSIAKRLMELPSGLASTSPYSARIQHTNTSSTWITWKCLSVNFSDTVLNAVWYQLISWIVYKFDLHLNIMYVHIYIYIVPGSGSPPHPPPMVMVP